MSQENLDNFLRTLQRFREGDFDFWVESFHEEGELVPLRAPIEGTFRGEARLREFLADNADSFDAFEPSYDDIRDLGDRILALGRLRIRGKEGGVEVEVPSALVATYRDGKVMRLEDFGDWQKALQSVGLTA